MGPERSEEARANAGNAIEPGEIAERAVRLTIGDDGLGKRQAHPGKTRQLLRGGPIGIDAFIGAERAGEGENTIAVSGGGPGRERLNELHFAGGLVRPGGQPADALAGQTQGEEQEKRTALGGWHARR